jgi:hypothetical protein
VAVMDVEIKLDVPGLNDGAAKEVEDAPLRERLVVDDEGGKIVFLSETSPVPAGTELRYNAERSQYALTDPKTHQYWLLSGAEVGSLFEGGPTLKRTHYSIRFNEQPETARIAGFVARRTDATVACDWSVHSRRGTQAGAISLTLAIWHSADPRLSSRWGDVMVDLLTYPLRDSEGARVLDELKAKIGFPLQVAMEGKQTRSPAAGEQHTPPKIVTTATRVELTTMARGDLALLPAGFTQAKAPYEFAKDSELLGPDMLGKLTPIPGPTIAPRPRKPSSTPR